MHYIRFLKTPSLSRASIGVHLNAKITITTDLGESFLSVDLPILVILVDHTGGHSQIYPYQWKAGKRELEISFPLPLTSVLSGQRPMWPCKLLVQPRDANYRISALVEIITSPSQRHRLGSVLPVLSEQLTGEPVIIPRGRGQRNVSEPAGQSSGPSPITIPKRVARHVHMANGDNFYVWEETGESIARHLWDAGLLLSAYLDSSGASIGSLGPTDPEYLKTLLSKGRLTVLELGTGCGIVGITMARRFPNAEVLITDMPEAEEIAKHNISMAAGQCSPDGSLAKISYQNLDWEKPLPESVRCRNLDLILVADCTYNSDVVPDLVKVLAELVKYNQEVLILVAMKIRHYSEMVFFDLMKERNMIVLDKLVFPFMLLGEADEAIELYFFKGR